MFETSVVTAGARRPQHRAVLVTASVGVHTFIVVAAIAASIQSINFPSAAPNQSELFMPTAPIPMPAGGGAPARAPEPPHQQPAAPQPPQQVTAPPQTVAPQTVPDAIPNVASTSTAPASDGPAGPIGPGTGGPGGGDPNSIGDGPGIGPGIGNGPAVAVEVPNVIFNPGADVKSAVVISRVQPNYPALPLKMKMGGVVTVHCVIDRNGRIRDPQVVRSTSPLFNDAALDAVKQWTFAPGTMHGTAVDTYFELTVTFSVR